MAYIEAGAQLFPMLTRSVPGIVARREDIGEDVDGGNVVVGIIDYGIDWTLPISAMKPEHNAHQYLWDQSLTPTRTKGHRRNLTAGWNMTSSK